MVGNLFKLLVGAAIGALGYYSYETGAFSAFLEKPKTEQTQ